MDREVRGRFGTKDILGSTDLVNVGCSNHRLPWECHVNSVNSCIVIERPDIVQINLLAEVVY